MKNIVNYDNFAEKDKTIVLDYENFMTNEFWQEAKNLYKKATTTGQEVDHQSKSKGSTVRVVDDNINKMNTEQPTGGAVSKFVTKTKDKLGRELTGTNAFIDTKSGKMCAMDVVLPKDDFSKVIELWKAGKKDDAANILKTFAIKERDAQFNIAVGLMMSASIAGLKSLKSQVIPKIDPSKIDMGGALGTDKGSYTGGDQRNFVEAPSEIAKSVGKAAGKGKSILDNPNLTFTPPDAMGNELRKLPKTVADHIDINADQIDPNLFSKQGGELMVNTASKAGRQLAKLNKLLNLEPSEVTKRALNKAQNIVQSLKDQNILGPEPIDKLDAMRKIVREGGKIGKAAASTAVDSAVNQASNLTPGQDVVNATTA